MIGRIVSHYRILQKIGGGGMGTVYKAEDQKLRRAVALKFLAPELTRDEDAKRRFIHEAQAASALDHPNICSIFDVDETPEGQLFIAMACYDGETLKERIARRPLEIREAFEIAFSVAQGLGRAHAANIIHRDIKPGNVMITNDGFVKIVDFGLAKLIGRSGVTGSGVTLGTVAYMSPEQAGRAEVDARADIWALGVILYEMISGQLPFRGEIDQAIVYSILHDAPRPLRELRKDVPETSAAVVMKCLEKDPGGRFQSAPEFCEALMRMADQLDWKGSFSAGHVRAASIVRGRPRRRPMLPAVLGLVSLVVLGALVWRALRPNVYSTNVRVAVMPFVRLGDTPNQAFVDGLAQWVAGGFDRASRVHSSMWVLPFARVLEDRPADLDRVAATFGVNRLVTGEVQRYGAGYQLSLAVTDANRMRQVATRNIAFTPEGIDSLPQAIATAIAGTLSLNPSEQTLAYIAGPRTRSKVAFQRFIEGVGASQRYTSATSLDSSLVSLTEAARADPGFAPSLAALGYTSYLQYYRTRDTAWLERAEPPLRRAVEVDSTYVPPYIYLAKVLRYSGRPEEGIALLRRAIARDPMCIDAYQDLGDALASLQRFDEADVLYQLLVTKEPDYYHGHWRRGWLYRRMNRPDLEIAEHQRAHQLAPEDHRTLNSLGVYYYQRGDSRAAREYWERAFILHPNCNTSSNVGSVMYFEGRFGDAARYYEYALEYCDSSDYVNWGNLACALYWTDGRRTEGIGTYRRAIVLAEARLALVPGDETTVARLADYYGMVGDTAQAQSMIERASGASDAEVYYRLACAYTSLGDQERAIDFIGKAVREHYPVLEIQREPLFRGLAGDARLRGLLETAAREREDQK